MSEVFDKRLVERRLRKGLITREEYEAYLKKLPDLTGQAGRFDAKLEPVNRDVFDNDDDDDDL